MNRKEILDIVYYDFGNQHYDYLVCGLKKSGDKVIATKWKKYSEVCFGVDASEPWKVNCVNQRQILPNEVVLDLEEEKQLQPTIQELEKLKCKFYAYSTGSRGYHIHVFFKKELTEKQKLNFIKHFGGDTQKASNKTMIALEFAPHWKSGKIKELLKWK